MGIKESFVDYAMDNYLKMPKSVQSKMIHEGKKKVEQDHPIASMFMSESTKEQLVKNYFVERQINNTNSFKFWDLFF